MKRYALFLTALLLSASQVPAQEMSQPEWRIMPGVLFVNYFPSSPVTTPNSGEYRFEGVGFQFIARAFHREYQDIAFTLSGGINWFGNAAPTYFPAPNSGSGVGASLQRRNFRSFPLMIGAEWIYPRSVERTLMLYAGASTGLHFIDGDLDMDQQTKFGYTLSAGFAVKVFEFGVRYYSFSDLRNLGVHLGVRLNSFPLE